MTKLQRDMAMIMVEQEEGSWQHKTIKNVIDKLEYYEDLMCDMEDRITFLTVIDERQEEVEI